MLTIFIFSFVLGMMAVSFNLIFGFTGQLSMFHAAAFGLSAYITYLTVNWLACVVLGRVAARAARGRGDLGVGRQHLLQVQAEGVLLRSGDAGVFRTCTPDHHELERRDERHAGADGAGQADGPLPGLAAIVDRRHGAVVFLQPRWLVLTVAVCSLVLRSWIGRCFAAIRLDEDLAQTLGIDIFRYKLLSFTLANLLAALAGSLYAFYSGYIEPAYLGIDQSLDVIAMVLLGGRGSMTGPILGALRADRLAASDRPVRRGAGHALRRHPDPTILLLPRGHRSAPIAVAAPCCLKSDNLTRRFGGLVAVSDVSFGIHEHEILGIFGPNGSGKTTLLNLISGIMPPSSGRIVWKSRDIQGWRPDHVAAAGVVKTFQNPQLFSGTDGARERRDREPPDAASQTGRRAHRRTAALARRAAPSRCR